jgi:hypothetical protein
LEFQLKQKDRLLGTLRRYDSDFPWINCKFEPAEAFHEFKSLFDEELEFMKSEPFDIEAWDAAYSKIINLNLELVDLTDESLITEFLLHIKEDEAWFRY